LFIASFLSLEKKYRTATKRSVRHVDDNLILIGRSNHMATINPGNIKTVAQWTRAFGKFRNVILGDDGTLLVLDPNLMRTDPDKARQTPAVTIKSKKNTDALLALTHGDPDTRNDALETIAKAFDAIEKAKEEAFGAFVTTEQALLDATDAYTRAKTTTQKINAALEVAKLSNDMMIAGRAYSERKTPLRHIKTLYGIPKKDIDYTTNDERAIPSISILIPQRIGHLIVEDTV
jgi:hypothetical protein